MTTWVILGLIFWVLYLLANRKPSYEKCASSAFATALTGFNYNLKNKAESLGFDLSERALATVACMRMFNAGYDPVTIQKAVNIYYDVHPDDLTSHPMAWVSGDAGALLSKDYDENKAIEWLAKNKNIDDAPDLNEETQDEDYFIEEYGFKQNTFGATGQPGN